jgi:hypothetical protein
MRGFVSHTTRVTQVMGRTVAPYTPPPELAAVPVGQLQAVVYRSNPDLRCRKLDPEMFFKSKTAEFARSLCGECPIRGECAELALREEMHGYFQGVRGGLSPGERRAIVKQRKQAAERTG